MDRATDDLMQRIIREEFKDCTIIAIAHRLHTILDFDRIAVLGDGAVRELDTVQSLLARDSEFSRMLARGDHEDSSGSGKLSCSKKQT